ARLKVEAVERVDDLQVLAVRAAHLAIGLGQINPESGVVSAVGDRKPVARKWTAGWHVQIKERMHARGPSERRPDQGYKQGEKDYVFYLNTVFSIPLHGVPSSMLKNQFPLSGD